VVAPDRRVFLHDLLDLPQTAEWRALDDAMDNAARNRGKRALTAALAANACRHCPTLLIVEDLHWADPQVLAHLAALASAIADGPGLLVMTSRVEGDPLDLAWRASCRGTPFETIDLGPLRHDEALSLAGSFIDATQRVALACIERAAGNPLFLEHCCAARRKAARTLCPLPSRAWCWRAWTGWRRATGRRSRPRPSLASGSPWRCCGGSSARPTTPATASSAMHWCCRRARIICSRTP
jgi:hypothetical protein